MSRYITDSCYSEYHTHRFTVYSKSHHIVIFLQAAALIHRFLSMDEAILKMSADAAVGMI